LMRVRSVTIFTILLMLFAAASPVLAQEGVDEEQTQEEGEGVVDEGEESSQEQSGEEAEEGGEGQSDADAETGAGEGEQEDAAATEEEGPPWTYQMAWITLVLLLLLFAAFGRMYYRGVVLRSRGS
jgi:hypothetical protein